MPIEKRYQVFVSSTYEDLREERQEVMQALLELNCIPTGMELFPATDEDSWTLIRQFIAECDYYVLIVAGRYGSVSPSGVSYTQMEYDFAVQAGIPTLAFLHESPGKIIAEKSESTESGRTALAGFRKLIESRRHCKYWNTPKDLGGIVSRGIATLTRTTPRIGWVRADRVPDESAAQEILKLRRRIDDLEARIAENTSTAPTGTEDLAQGDETISVHFRYETPNTNGHHDGLDSLSWNAILSALGPILIQQASEQSLKDKIEEVLSNRYTDGQRSRIYGVYMRDEEFQQIKLQLRALGLIKVAGNGEATWTLTPYGDQLMTQVAAIRSKSTASRPSDNM